MTAVGQNSASFPASFVSAIRSDTGVTTTVAAAGTALPILGALFVQARNTLPEAFLWDPLTGVLTITREQGAGVYDIEVMGADIQGSNSGAKILRISKTTAAGVVSLVGSQARGTEAAAAVRSSVGPAYAAGVTLAKGDKVSVVADVSVNGNVVISRDLVFKLTKVSNS